ncbi:MAG: hypothetical protein KKH52_00145 [Nanoarchaeota archaeon]|nr:hypothetical protein [Nanoarchaeota archaeon]MBU1623126.1 hypothetical protein [Nanoarchaeota archaeon]MBU1973786.1 hypothetical protein [Nanoarchaeota archaeon]
MKRQGMAIGQVFIFIIAAITFALIMIFGYKTITGFLESGEEVAFVQFKTDLENSVKKIYTEYGAVRVETFQAPLEHRQICFVDLDYPPEKIDEEMDALCALDQNACDLWQTAREEGGYASVDANVFLKPMVTVPIKVYKIELYNEDDTQRLGYHCLPISQGTFKIVLEGRGDKTRITEVVQEYE